MEQNQPLQPQEKNDDKRRVTLRVAAIVAIVATLLGLIASAAYSWQHGEDLHKKYTETESQISSLKQELQTLDAKIATSEDQNNKKDSFNGQTNKVLEGNIGEVIDTKVGSLVVNSYKKTSLNELLPSYTSKDPILGINVAIVNTSGTTQIYSSSQFKFVNASKTVINTQYDIHRDDGYAESIKYLTSVSLEPGGSLETNVYFDEYDSQAGTLKWNASPGQEVRVTIPKL